MQTQILVNGNAAHNFELISPSFVYHGASVFTTLLALKKTPLFLDRHLKRLESHATELGLAYPGNALFLADIEKLLTMGPELRLRLCIGEQIRIVEASTYVPPPPSYYTEGIQVCLTGYQVHPNLAHLKTGNHLPYRLAAQKAHLEGAFEGLLVDRHGHVVDGSRTSPLLYKNGVLTVLKGGLDGITRQRVVEAAQDNRIQIRSEFLSFSELDGQLLLAGSGVGLLSVGQPVDEAVRQLIQHFSPRYLMSQGLE